MNGALPEGWARAQIRQFATLNPRHPRTLSDSLLVSFVPMAAVSDSKPEFDHLEERPLGKVRQGFTHFSNGDVLFAKITPCMENGKGAVATGLRHGIGCGTTELIVIRPLGGFDPHYVYRFLAQPMVRAEAKDHFTGTAGQARVPTSFIEELEIPLAPLAEQRRIVSKVEALLEEVNGAKARLDRVSLILKRFRRSVLEAACHGIFTSSPTRSNELPREWRYETLDKLVVADGIFDGARDHGTGTRVESNLRSVDYTSSGVRVIRLENLGHLNFIDTKKTYISESKYVGLAQSTVRPGDILFGSFVDDALRVCVVPILNTVAIAKADCFCVRPDVKSALSDYLALQLASERTRHWLLEHVHGVTRPRITTKQLRSIPVPVCSIEEQGKIVSIANQFFTIAQAIERCFAKASDRLSILPRTILAKAFAGELVPTEAELARRQGRDYESASALLQRIQREPLHSVEIATRSKVSVNARKANRKAG